MLYEHRRPDVAVFIDFENVYVSVRDKLDENPNFETIMERCHDLGRVIIARAYADWYRYPRITSALYANSIEPMYVPTYYYDKDVGRTGRAIKNSVDMNICIDAMKTLFTHQNVEKFVLVTGDRDFIPLVHSIRQQGKEVVVIGIGGAASTHLAQSADEFLFYEQLVGKPAPAQAHKLRHHAEPTPAAEAPAAPAPDPDIYDTLVEAVRLVRERGYVSTLGSIKLVMKELMGGDFKENRYKDVNGRAFTKFKDFVQDAERRGRVQIFTSGTVNEVFLPGEDPLKLSQFAGDLREESPADVSAPADVSVNGHHAAAAAAETTTESSSSSGGSSSSRNRRRRRRKPASERTSSDSPQQTSPDIATGDAEDDAEPEAVVEMDAAEAEAVATPTAAIAQPEEIELPDLVDDDESPAVPEIEPYDDPEQSAALQTSRQIEADAAELLGSVWSYPADTADTADHEQADTPARDDQPAVEPAVSMAEVSADPTPQPADDPVAEATAAGADAEPEEVFSDEEWQAFRAMMAEQSRPISFTQMLEGLRSLRNQQVINRTNEQIRTLAKQAINSGMLDRSGRGTRIYYTLKQADGDEHGDSSDSSDSSDPSDPAAADNPAESSPA